MITLYRILTFLFCPFLLIWMLIRIIKGKENLSRIKERFGFSSKRANDQSYIWIHAASVGESLIALTLIEHISKAFPSYHFVITTGTITSAKIMASRLPQNAIHQFVPIDEYFAVNRFFEQWQPKLGILIESEIWPNLLNIGAKNCPLILTNAIMSERSFIKWQRFHNFAEFCLDQFSLILCQSVADKQKYQQLCTTKIEYIGNLKYSSSKPTFNQRDYDNLHKQTNSRLILLAASTHPGDEDIIIKAHQKLKIKYPNLLTIISPRHPHRSEEVQKIIATAHLKSAIRSQNGHIKIDTDIYLADSLGEMGLFFNLAHVTFIGGSFYNGGHNIIEPAFFNTRIIVGPNMSNFLAITQDFVSHNAILQAQNENDLIDKIDLSFTKIADTTMIDRAKKLLKQNSNIINSYIEQISDVLHVIPAKADSCIGENDGNEAR